MEHDEGKKDDNQGAARGRPSALQRLGKPARGETEGRAEDRITSYNVCYTKLLRRVNPHDVGRVEEHVAEPTLLRQIDQRRIRVGEGDELRAVLGWATGNLSEPKIV